MWNVNWYRTNSNIPGSFNLSWFNTEGEVTVQSIAGGGGAEHGTSSRNALQRKRSRLIRQDEEEVVLLMKMISKWL